jgi:hypothetical protein
VRSYVIPAGTTGVQVVFDRLGNDPELAAAAGRETRVVIWEG